MPNQALARLASRPALDLNESADPLDSEDDLLVDALGAADKGIPVPAELPDVDEIDLDLPGEFAEVEQKEDADPGALQGPLQGDPSKGGALSAPGVKPADKKKPAPARKPAPAAAKRRVKKPAKPAAKPDDQTEKAYISPKPPAFWNRRKVGVQITKAADGRRLMLMVTSNSYKDREDEAVATKALKEYVNDAWNRVEGKCLPDNVMQFWHGGDIGDTVWCDTEGPFLLEVHKERPNKRINIARKGSPPVYTTIKAVWDYLETNPDNIEWGASHGFEFFKRHKSADGTYHRIRKFESSVLPLQWAANPYTFAGVAEDMEPRDKLLNQMVGDRTGKAFRKGARALEKVLAARGLQHKERRSDATEKGLVEDLSDKLDAALSKISDDPETLKVIKQAVVGVLAEEDENADPLVTRGTQEEAEAGYRYASLDDDEGDDSEPDEDEDDDAGMSKKGLKLLDALIDTQEGIYEGIQEIAARQKALDPLAKLPARMDSFEKRFKAMEMQLKMRPQAASESNETEEVNPDLLGQVQKAMSQFDPFFGVHVADE
jgi:hypothetical protein